MSKKPEIFTPEEATEHIHKLYEGFHLLLWDYHNRFHKDDADHTGYQFCIEWPCLQFRLDIFK